MRWRTRKRESTRLTCKIVSYNEETIHGALLIQEALRKGCLFKNAIRTEIVCVIYCVVYAKDSNAESAGETSWAEIFWFTLRLKDSILCLFYITFRHKTEQIGSTARHRAPYLPTRLLVVFTKCGLKVSRNVKKKKVNLKFTMRLGKTLEARSPKVCNRELGGKLEWWHLIVIYRISRVLFCAYMGIKGRTIFAKEWYRYN